MSRRRASGWKASIRNGSRSWAPGASSARSLRRRFTCGRPAPVRAQAAQRRGAGKARAGECAPAARPSRRSAPARRSLNETRSQLLAGGKPPAARAGQCVAPGARRPGAPASAASALKAELPDARRPDAAAANALRTRIAALEAAVQAAQAGHEALQSEVRGARRAQRLRPARRSARRSASTRQPRAQLATLRQIQAAAEDNAPLREMARAAWPGRAAALVAEAAHRPGLGDRRGIGAARTPARARAFRSRAAAVGSCRSPPAKASVFARGQQRGHCRRARLRAAGLQDPRRGPGGFQAPSRTGWPAPMRQKRAPTRRGGLLCRPAQCSSTAMATSSRGHTVSFSRAGSGGRGPARKTVGDRSARCRLP